jgi:hypothetical protein
MRLAKKLDWKGLRIILFHIYICIYKILTPSQAVIKICKEEIKVNFIKIIKIGIEVSHFRRCYSGKNVRAVFSCCLRLRLISFSSSVEKQVT